MADIEPFPFADVDDLKARWPALPAGAEERAGVLLEDASQFILDVAPQAAQASEATRRRVVCAVVRRYMESENREGQGLTQFQISAGPYQQGGTFHNPDGAFYLRADEKKALGVGKQQAFGVKVAGFAGDLAAHRPWCSLRLGATYCSCGADIAGEPIYEG